MGIGRASLQKRPATDKTMDILSPNIEKFSPTTEAYIHIAFREHTSIPEKIRDGKYSLEKQHSEKTNNMNIERPSSKNGPEHIKWWDSRIRVS